MYSCQPAECTYGQPVSNQEELEEARTESREPAPVAQVPDTSLGQH